jgi:hypothetical protein
MNNYHETAARNIAINEDHNGMFCTIPSEMDSKRCYELRCIESAHEVVVCSCTCKGFSYYRRCKHVGIVQAMWNRIYKSNTKANTSQFATRKAAPVAKKSPLVRKSRNGGLVLVKAPAKKTAVAKVIEQAVEAVVPTPKKDMMNAALTTNQGFQLMR